ncbi:hypothetical protein JCM19233_5951 [Vibrio astriarenae]|nr:hypothetical protein JCM19233_5951 [Vibrio sp. C7]
MEAAKSLDALIVWRQRANIGGNGLSYKTEQGRLVAHRYTEYEVNKKQ